VLSPSTEEVIDAVYFDFYYLNFLFLLFAVRLMTTSKNTGAAAVNLLCLMHFRKVKYCELEVISSR